MIIRVERGTCGRVFVAPRLGLSRVVDESGRECVCVGITSLRGKVAIPRRTMILGAKFPLTFSTPAIIFKKKSVLLIEICPDKMDVLYLNATF